MNYGIEDIFWKYVLQNLAFLGCCTIAVQLPSMCDFETWLQWICFLSRPILLIVSILILTQWSLNKMVKFGKEHFKHICLNANVWICVQIFNKFHQLFQYWPGTKQATHYLSQWWHCSLMPICITRVRVVGLDTKIEVIVVIFPGRWWHHNDQNQGINFYSIMMLESIFNLCRFGCV